MTDLDTSNSAPPWVDGLTFGAVLERTVERFAERDALVFPGCDYRINYRQFAEEVERAARGLLALGIQPGEHVALWATNVPEWVILQFATARIGAVLVTVNPAYRPFELQCVLKQSDVVALADEPPAGAITWSEMCRRGETVDPAAVDTIAATLNASDGWLHSGDLAVRRPDGYYRITGRIKDMVIRGGENIYPREIEEFLFTHPAIEQAAVLGVPDHKYSEQLCAWVKLKTGESLDANDLRQFCRENLAHFKVPHYVQFVDAFPQTVTGKIQKFKIREEMIEKHELQEAETA